MSEAIIVVCPECGAAPIDDMKAVFDMAYDSYMPIVSSMFQLGCRNGHIFVLHTGREGKAEILRKGQRGTDLDTGKRLE